MPTREKTEGQTRIVESETEARQGATGHGVRWVLALGFGGAFVALLIAVLVFALGNGM